MHLRLLPTEKWRWYSRDVIARHRSRRHRSGLPLLSAESGGHDD